MQCVWPDLFVEAVCLPVCCDCVCMVEDSKVRSFHLSWTESRVFLSSLTSIASRSERSHRERHGGCSMEIGTRELVLCLTVPFAEVETSRMLW